MGLSSSSSSSGVEMEVVEEGSEPAEFVKALGPQDKKAYDCMLKGASSHSHSHTDNAAKSAGTRSELAS